ncbi:hypothetical protein BKA70DRAFT_838995 [Coprinopsis sp. MPI-PUGE-AT-0042]|nr:hypothetical protein BKA70DRAFT_838995 [Coprinopsis sp. MPI-PUGE-AT-0042]
MWPFPYLVLILGSRRSNTLHAFWPHTRVTAATTISTSPRPGSLCIPFIHTSKPRNPPLACLIQVSVLGWPTRTTWLLPGGSNVRRSAGGM